MTFSPGRQTELPRSVYAVASAVWTLRGMQGGLLAGLATGFVPGLVLILMVENHPGLTPLAAGTVFGSMLGSAVWAVLLQLGRVVLLEVRCRLALRSVLARLPQRRPTQWQVAWAIEPYDPGTDVDKELGPEGKHRNAARSTLQTSLGIGVLAIFIALLAQLYTAGLVIVGVLIAHLSWIAHSPDAADRRAKALKAELEHGTDVAFFPLYPTADRPAEEFPLYRDLVENPLFPIEPSQRDRANNPDCQEHAGSGWATLSGFLLCFSFVVGIATLDVFSRTTALFVVLAVAVISLIPAYAAFRRNVRQIDDETR